LNPDPFRVARSFEWGRVLKKENLFLDFLKREFVSFFIILLVLGVLVMIVFYNINKFKPFWLLRQTK
jgi:hypothetical protein